MAEEQQPDIVKQSEADAKTEWQELLALLREYGTPLLGGLGAALFLYFGYVGYRAHKQAKTVRAARNLATAQSADQWRQIVQEYPATPSAPIAQMTLASQYLHSGQYPLARKEFATFIERYPDHAMKLPAEMGLAYCLEAEGQLEGALSSFTRLARQNPEHFIAPVATFSRGRCLEQFGQYEEARAVYEDFIAANPDSRWVARAETALLYVDKEIRAKERGLPTAGASFSTEAVSPLFETPDFFDASFSEAPAFPAAMEGTPGDRSEDKPE